MRRIKALSITVTVWLLSLALLLNACGPETEETADDDTDRDDTPEEITDPLAIKGVGPIESVELDDELDEEMIVKGRDIFESRCESCHRFDTRRVGPAVGGITERRSPEWIMNMILNPSEMLAEDPIGQKLRMEYATTMTYQNISEEGARAILEYFRQRDREEDFDIEDVL